MIRVLELPHILRHSDHSKAGVKIPKKKVKKGEEKTNDFSSRKLDGEAYVSVEVFDSCDEVHKKINAYLKGPRVTQAGFLREAALTYPDWKKMQSKQLQDFLGKKGAHAGNTSATFYSSYVFFDKIRIKEGQTRNFEDFPDTDMNGQWQNAKTPGNFQIHKMWSCFQRKMALG